MAVELQTPAESATDDRSAGSVVSRHDIIRALTDACKKETGEYEKLLIQWRDLQLRHPESDSFLKVRLKALSQAVSYIKEKEHDLLISFILGMSLWMHDLDVADALIEFIINLATVNGGLLQRCLDMLVRNFIPPSSGLPLFIDFLSRRALMKGMPKETLTQWKTEHMDRKDDILKRVHSAIARISELVPMTTLHLKPIVVQRMPHRVVDKEWNVLYLENMLRLAQDAQGEFIRNQMIMGVIDRLVEIDVEIRWEDILCEDDSSKVCIFDMDFDETLEENEVIEQGGPGSEAQHLPVTPASNGKKRQSLCAVADKMDFLMDMTLQHLKNYFDAGQIELIFDVLMHSFQSTMLDTFKLKFTQFLVFYACSVAPTTCGAKFAAVLCDALTSTNRAPTSRMSAAAYLASFLARAKNLPLAVVSSSLRRVVDWCAAYTPRQGDNKGNALNADSGVHGVFYSACQAVMYVLCFRMRSLLDDPHERESLRRLRLNDFVKHTLNPLKVCLPSVVEEFLKQTTKAHLVDESLSKLVNQTIVTSNTINRLDMFFPFDPYLLRQSDRFIRPNFIFWSMVPVNDDDDDDDDVSDVELEGDDSELDSSPRTDACPDTCMTPSSIPRSYATVMETGSLSDKDMEDFEICMNRMSLTRKLEQPIPLPPKLTPEFLLRFSMSLL